MLLWNNIEDELRVEDEVEDEVEKNASPYKEVVDPGPVLNDEANLSNKARSQFHVHKRVCTVRKIDTQQIRVYCCYQSWVDVGGLCAGLE